MPQLLSRMDDLNWLTPSIADILEQGAAPPGGDGSMRDMVSQLEEEFAASETPAKVVNLRPTPSYTLFLLQPETVGRLGSRRVITPAELRRSSGQIAERHKDWRLGFLAQVEDTPEAVGLLVRTDKHRPLSLRRLLIRAAFRDYPSSLAFTLGNTLEQRLIVRDLEETPHLLIVGDSAARQHLMSSLILTLTLFNTPNEMRILFNGRGGESYAELARLPHASGDAVQDGEALITLLTGLMNEAQARLDRFYEEGVNQITAYNTRMRDQAKMGISRVLLVLDALTDEAFQPILDRAMPLVRDLLVNGAQVGIHVLATLNQPDEMPAMLKKQFPIEVYLRSAAPELGDKVKNWHTSLGRFIDAFVVDTRTGEITPVEWCAVSANEMRGALEYWQGVAAQRKGSANPPDLLTGIPMTAAPPSLHQAAMLAAYLGWVSMGVLRDVFSIADADAHHLIQALQASGVVETGSSPMLRFVRLAERP